MNNISLNIANKKTGQSFSDFHAGIDAGAQVTFDTGQFIFLIPALCLLTLLLFCRVLTEKLLEFQKCMNCQDS